MRTAPLSAATLAAATVASMSTVNRGTPCAMTATPPMIIEGAAMSSSAWLSARSASFFYFEKHLPCCPARLELLVSFHRVGQREGVIDSNLHRARRKPAKQILRAHHQLIARRDVLIEPGPRQEQRSLDAEDRGIEWWH